MMNNATNKPRAILGIGGVHDRGNAHDASASLIIDGDVIAAVEEDRFSRVKKHLHLGYPLKAIEYCLHTAGIKIQDLTDIAIESRVGDPAHITSALSSEFGDLPIKPVLVSHHMAHAASAIYASPFERGCFIVIDAHGGMRGVGVSTIAGGFEGNRIDVIDEIWTPFSLGLAWAFVTDHLGFNKHTDAGKVMGLAAFSEDRRYFDLFKMTETSFLSSLDSSILKNIQDTPTYHSDFEGAAALAHALQWHTELCIKGMAKRLCEHYNTKNLCLAGGVALNSVANGKLLSEGIVDNVFIQPAADDSGLSLGNALYISHAIHDCERSGELDSIFLGPEYSSTDIVNTITKAGLRYSEPADIYGCCAQLMAKGNILGWFQGRLEYGPRALGNRSILCDPRGSDTKSTLNAKIKHREAFRPFAAAVVAEKASAHFTICESPYMLLVGKPHSDDMPAITHADGTTRLQTVSAAKNKQFHSLLSAFDRLTGLPVLLNTSLNVMGEPIVENPTQALRCFQETEMDAICLGKYIITKNG